jgi:hypothetical protein
MRKPHKNRKHDELYYFDKHNFDLLDNWVPPEKETHRINLLKKQNQKSSQNEITHYEPVGDFRHWLEIKDAIVENYCWRLYSTKEAKNEDCIVGIQLNAGNEIDLMYDTLKYDVGWKNDIVDLKGRAEKLFSEMPDGHFQFIIKEDLSDLNMYITSQGNERRDFCGWLLQKIVKRHCGVHVGRQKLGEIYQKKFSKWGKTNNSK